jgi:hypothetical protein
MMPHTRSLLDLIEKAIQQLSETAELLETAQDEDGVCTCSFRDGFIAADNGSFFP